MRLMLIVGCCCFAPNVWALDAKNIFVIANQNMPESLGVARHYAKVRQVPADNILALDLPKTEDISRADYDQKLAKPLREALKSRGTDIQVLLCVYGVPLRVGGLIPNAEDQKELKELGPKLKIAQEKAKTLREEVLELEAKNKETNDPARNATIREKRAALQSAQTQVTAMERQRGFYQGGESQASVDSELMLLRWDDYELRRWQTNLLNRQLPNEARAKKPVLYMTCRLDGPTPAIAKRLVDDAIATEKDGLKGKVYVDARGIKYDAKSDRSGTGYGGYDESMREMATLLRDVGKMEVVLDDKNELFAPKSCPDTAFYCGWYSHANFIDCCEYNRGSIAWHLASSEAVSLRRADAKYWCKNMLEKGVCATVGPVAEPYTVGFPKPAEFFGLLATGEFTLVECYAKTLLLTSWMGTLIGDPLYNPYGTHPRFKSDKVGRSPIDSAPLFR